LNRGIFSALPDSRAAGKLNMGAGLFCPTQGPVFSEERDIYGLKNKDISFL
jgi:hypothetical protein